MITRQERFLVQAESGLTDEQFTSVERLYEEPSRAYHTFDHALEVAKWAMLSPWSSMDIRDARYQKREAVVAALFHDCVYIHGAEDNEDLSIEHAHAMLGSEDLVDCSIVSDLISATKLHFTGGVNLELENINEGTKIFMDCDIITFGADYNTFEMADDNLLFEANGCAPFENKEKMAEVCGKRKAFLVNLPKLIGVGGFDDPNGTMEGTGEESWYGQDTIFNSRWGIGLFEKQAQENVARIIKERYSEY